LQLSQQIPTKGEGRRQSRGTRGEKVVAVEHVTSGANKNNLMDNIRANCDCELCVPSQRNATYFLSFCEGHKRCGHTAGNRGLSLSFGI
jgi:hypothetical protein